MKKLLTILLALLLCSCTAGQTVPAEEETPVDLSSLSIVTPKGAPVLAFYDQIANENYVRVAADALGALWTGEESPDVLVSDISSGVKAIGNGAAYKLAAVITFGNFYLAATGNDDDQTMNEGDKIVLFGNENMLPSKIFHYLFADTFNDSLSFVADAQTAAGTLASGKDLEGNDVDYVFVAQPAMTGALKKNAAASVYLDIQKEYKDRSSLQMIQAGVFLKDSVDAKTAEAFLQALETSIGAVVADPDVAKEGLGVYQGDEAVAQYGINPDLAIAVLKQKNAYGENALGLGFKRAYDIKADIDAFLGILGGNETSEDIYIK